MTEKNRLEAPGPTVCRDLLLDLLETLIAAQFETEAVLPARIK